MVAGYGQMTILNGTTFAVKRAAITTIIGPNGAGKSTVFKAIFGMLPVRSGHITLEGTEITNWAPRRLLEAGVIYVPQGRNIFPELSVFHNLELGTVAARGGSDIPPGSRRLWRVSPRSRRSSASRPPRSPAASRSSSKSPAACCSTPGWC